jgi:FAD/FMN-containing dehydrogenase
MPTVTMVSSLTAQDIDTRRHYIGERIMTSSPAEALASWSLYRASVADGQTHERAVDQLREQYARIPAGDPVRLAKRTSNLFRFGAAQGHGLDVSALDQVLSVDPQTRTAQVQGMTTYENLVDATLAHGLMPFVVPQLKTITLGGAVAGLGIESSSYRNGLPHESVREIEVLTGDGRVIVARPDNEHADLFRAFPNSYGTLGYTLRLQIDLEPVQPYVRLRHLRFDTAEDCLAEMGRICTEGSYDGEPVQFVDGTVFSAQEQYVTLGSFVDEAPRVSDYTGMDIYYRSIQRRSTDYLTVRDYLWRWDTDWFWCSRALGVQQPLVRRLWPGRYKRSDVYRRIVAFDRRHDLSGRVARWRGQPQEPVVQDVEIPIEATPKFLDVFHRDIGIEPIWLCPLRLRADRAWPLYPLEPAELYVNVGFWSSVTLRPGQVDGHYNRLIEDAVSALGGHKSLYSTVHYSEEEFWQRYNGPAYQAVKGAYDPQGRLPDLYRKVSR